MRETDIITGGQSNTHTNVLLRRLSRIGWRWGWSASPSLLGPPRKATLRWRRTCPASGQIFLIKHIYRHDTIADTFGVMASPFGKMFPQKALEMKRMVMNYVKALQAMLPATDGIPVSGPTADNTQAVVYNGFPKLPADFNLAGYLKSGLEDLYRSYIGAHYCTCFST